METAGAAQLARLDIQGYLDFQAASLAQAIRAQLSAAGDWVLLL